jgi:ComF family protein
MPVTCEFCGEILVKGERTLCLNCVSKLPYAELPNENLIKRVNIYGRVEHIAVWLKFDKGNITQNLIHKFKYYDKIRIGRYLAELWCANLQTIGWMNEIDVVIPLPLHRFRKIQRGFNQSEILAVAIGKAFNKPVVSDAVKRTRYTKSQASQAKNRWTNTDNAFAVCKPETLKGKRILIVDDVITTGASVANCIRALYSAQPLSVSIATLASSAY